LSILSHQNSGSGHEHFRKYIQVQFFSQTRDHIVGCMKTLIF